MKKLPILIVALLISLTAFGDYPLLTPFLPIEEELDSIFYINNMFKPYEVTIGGEPGALTDDDYREVAKMMGVEVAAIKAVVDIETGKKSIGFYETGKPLINFDLSIYRARARRHGVDLAAAQRQSPEIFRSPNIKKYGSQQLAQQARLDQAIAINEESALEGTFWGMFQIGGFNWQLVGCESVQEFVELMSRSERDQLELFARYCQARDLTKYIKARNWAAFSLRYNGQAYAAQGYHTKMAESYHKYKRQGY
ncbi:MAG: N-acetylmuramidase family protein [Muribaculaceae bacterium]|nr:N-acetylmuramidase family protein [Muribaculaceae bacterium]